MDDIIKREVNPFDPTTFKPGNFWREQQDSTLTVNSIHQEAIAEIEGILDLVARDHRSRTVMLAGDSGSGKSYLLGRLKRTLNPKAFFAYIGPWPDSNYIWRHILRYTVDGLMQIPDGQQDSQLILWLKSLAAFKQLGMEDLLFNESVWNLLRSDRQRFIIKLRDTYRNAGIYNPDIFFGVLHDLTNPELYNSACEWLRGDDLSENSLLALNVRRSIETEVAAWEILSNFGRISTATQPIVLSFDQLEAIDRLPDGSLDLQALFSVNSKIQNESWKNFLIIISITTDIWKQNVKRIYQADKAGIYKAIPLKRITLDQAEALWALRLQPIHSQAKSQQPSKIYPLTRQVLEQKFPGCKTDPRNALMLGRKEYQKYKDKIIGPLPPPHPITAEFQLQWQNEYNKVQEKITRVTLLSAPELVRMLQEALAALQVQEIKPRLLSGKFASYSLSYQQSDQRERVGVVWTEDASMRSFYSVMNACQGAVNSNLYKTLYLLRGAGLGNPRLAGNQIYRQIFASSQHRHIKPTLSSVHYLAAYHNLVNAALANELVVANKILSLKELETLIRESKILQKCKMLQNLGIVPSVITPIEQLDTLDLTEVKESLFNTVKIQGFLGRPILIQQARSQFSSVNESEVEQLIQQLCQEDKIQIVNPNAKREAQSVCLVVPQR